MAQQRIAVIGGDGIGPEVTEAAVATLEAIAPGTFVFDHLPYCADYTLQTGTTIEPDAFERLRTDYDAILLGALGDPRIPDMRHARDILMAARQRFELFVNLRPARLLAAHLTPLKGYEAGDIDLVILRENTEGLYVGVGGVVGRDSEHEIGTSTMVATRRATERILHEGFRRAAARPRRRLCLASKHNAIPEAYGVWLRAFERLRSDYPDVDAKVLFADVAAMELVRDPTQFDVLVCSNFVGDILSDLAAQLVGGLGLAASGNLRPGGLGLFEPVHGSAPTLAGTGRANPLAAIQSAAMLARHLGHDEVARAIEGAILAVVRAGETTPDLGGRLTTAQGADAVRNRLDQQSSIHQGA